MQTKSFCNVHAEAFSMFQYALPCGSDSDLKKAEQNARFNTHSLAGVIPIFEKKHVKFNFNTHSLAGVIRLNFIIFTVC